MGIEQKSVCSPHSFWTSNGSRSGLKHVLISEGNRFTAGVRSVRVALITTIVVVVVVAGRGARLVIGSVGIEETLTPSMATVDWTSVVISHFDVLPLIVGLVGLVTSGRITSIGIVLVGIGLRIVSVVVAAIVVAPVGVVGGISAVVSVVGTSTRSWFAWIQLLKHEKVAREALEGFCTQFT